jgi:hypothetical protein
MAGNRAAHALPVHAYPVYCQRKMVLRIDFLQSIWNQGIAINQIIKTTLITVFYASNSLLLPVFLMAKLPVGDSGGG